MRHIATFRAAAAALLDLRIESVLVIPSGAGASTPFSVVLKLNRGVEAMTSERLFSYGTLQLEAVQLATFGRRLTGTPDVLIGFAVVPLTIDDPAVIGISGKTVHTMATFTGLASDVIAGTVFDVSLEEIRNADAYEVAAVRRVSAVTQSGTRAWVYIDANCDTHI